MKQKHTDREYEGELTKLREQLLTMGARVEDMIAGATRALTERDSALAAQMIALDDEINRLEVETDELCLVILAKRQPVASDLRTITTAMKMVTDLERIGDLGVNISERVMELNTEPPLKPYVDVAKMGEAVQGMVRDALDAFVNRDVERAQRVIERDRSVDAFYGQTLRVLLTYMMEDARNISRASKVQAIAKHLERVGDHATNLAEMVIFSVNGEDIRHARSLESHRVTRGLLFVSARNAARSQMAEGIARSLMPRSVKVYSAGAAPSAAVDPLAVRVMGEIGIDISGARPKGIADIPIGEVDTVITLGSGGMEDRSANPLKRSLDWHLGEPGARATSEEERLAAFRTSRDQLKERIQGLLDA